MANETPLDEMKRYLYGIVYPTTKETVLETAQRNGAHAGVMDRLSCLRSRVAGPHEVLIVLREGGWTVRDRASGQNLQQPA